MVAVTAEDVRKLLGLTDADIADENVTSFIEDATTLIQDKLDTTIDYSNTTAIRALNIKKLAAVYLYAHITGGSAIGLNISIGGVSVSQATPESVKMMLADVKEFLAKGKPIALIVGEDRAGLE